MAMEEYKSAEAKYIALREKIAYDNKLALLEKRQGLETADLNIKTMAQKTTGHSGCPPGKSSICLTVRKIALTRFELRSEINGEVIRKHIAVGESVKKDF